ncbi:TonB-dependent receptor [Ravibacter arvi]|uniref:TonB-dependent receptor n=1 Tax=Ravibacter arvi TaxID=2051041 RepID=A0ABP8LNI3_9BACT
MKKFLMILIFGLGLNHLFAQERQVSGTVKDHTGTALPGVSVLVHGTSIGTMTDLNGKYSIVPNNAEAILVFSFVGFDTQRVPLEGRRSIDVTLVESNQSLNEVVVVGFGTQKKASMVGAIANADMTELRKASPSNLTNAIGGRIPGVVTRMMDGAIGGTQNRYSNGDQDDAQFFIRGKATTNGQSPLVLIDGVEGSFSRINPEDIEQFSVLKDASATAVYGVRGANGVILITTRKGVVGKPKINIISQFRFLQPLKFPKFLGSYDYASLHNEARRNMGLSSMYSDEDLEHYRKGDQPFTHPDVNWYDLLVKKYTTEQQHIANITGGTEKVRYYVSGEFNKAGGLFVGSKQNEYVYRRFNLRSNLDFTLTPTTQLDVKINARLNDLNFAAKGESSGQRVNATAWGDIVNRLPNTSPLYNPNGTYAAGDGVLGWNTLSDLYDGGFYRRLFNTLEANFALTQKLDFVTPGLSFRGKYANSFGSGATKYFYAQPDIWKYNPANDTYSMYRARIVPSYSVNSGFQDYSRTEYVEASLNYDRTFSEVHQLTGMAVFIQNKNEIQYQIPNSFRGVSGRVTYGYKGKYLVEGNVGYNGSDRFSKHKRYALFPAAALGWVVSEEGFLKDKVKFLDFLKIRGSYGQVGNDQIAGFQYLYRYEFSNPPEPLTSNTNPSYYALGVSPVPQIGLIEGPLGNDQVSWEIAKKSNIGVDMRFFNSRLSFTADFFREKRDNVLARRNDLPLYSGLTASKLPAMNIGIVTNRGYELELSYRDQIGDFGFTVGANYTFVRNTIDYIAEVPQRYAYQVQAGNSIGRPMGYIWTGKFYDTPELSNPEIPKPMGAAPIPGDLMFKDLNGDGVIDAFDRTYIGYSDMPEKIFGFNLSLDYKNFYLSSFWQGASNVNMRLSGPLSFEFGPNVQPFHKEGRWVYDPDRGLDTRATATYPALQIGASTYTREASTFNLLNAEYLRLKTAEFGYIVPADLAKKVGMSGLRIFVNGSNLLTFDHLKKYNVDPEYFTNRGSSNGAGTGAYSPQNKFYAIGLNATF